MRKMQSSLLFPVALVLLVGWVDALAPPYPYPYEQEQPDGTVVTLRLQGHPYDGVFQTDEIGHPVLNDKDGWFVYARYHNTTDDEDEDNSFLRKRQEGRRRKRRRLQPSLNRVGIDPPPSIDAPSPLELGDLFDTPSIMDGQDTTQYHDTASPEDEDDMLCIDQPRSKWCPDNPSPVAILRSRSHVNPSIGVLKVIVVMVKFRDHADRYVPPKEDFETLFNGGFDNRVAPTGSVKEFFKIQSLERLRVESTVLDWYVGDKDEETVAFGRHGLHGMYHEMANGALRHADETGIITNWSDYDTDGDGKLDSIFIVHSGFAAEVGGTDCVNGKEWGTHRIWSHRSSARGSNVWHSRDGTVRTGPYATTSAFIGSCGNRIARIGVVGHEMVHLFGVPDLARNHGRGAGCFDMMGIMWGMDGSQYYPGLVGAWTRQQLGWVQPTVAVPGFEYPVRASAVYPDVFRIDTNFPPGEYLLIENRVKAFYDLKMPGEGLLIWHIDENADTDWQNARGWPGEPGWPGNKKHYHVAVVQADGLYELEQAKNNAGPNDLWTAGKVLRPGPGTQEAVVGGNYPNTDSYSTDRVFSTGVIIDEISNPGRTMTFRFRLAGEETAQSLSTVDIRTPEPSPQPTKEPTPWPTPWPTPLATREPTPWPTREPTPWPTREPTPWPTREPTPWPTREPTPWPTQEPTPLPTREPTPLPTQEPTPWPTRDPTNFPTGHPTPWPTREPTPSPTPRPSSHPTHPPTPWPSSRPTPDPTPRPTHHHTPRPTPDPTPRPTHQHTPHPTPDPTPRPTHHHTPHPTRDPTPHPTHHHTPRPTPNPTPRPTHHHTPHPTPDPTPRPTHHHTPHPTPRPTHPHTPRPTPRPTPHPTPHPTRNPTPRPTPHPTPNPTFRPTPSPTPNPTPHPTPHPTPVPTEHPILSTTLKPTPLPTPHPIFNNYIPSPYPTQHPTPHPTREPTPNPTESPTRRPTPAPTDFPTRKPTEQPTVLPMPSSHPTATASDTPTASPRPSPSPSMTPTTSVKPTRSPPTRLPTIHPTRRPTLLFPPLQSPSPTRDLFGEEFREQFQEALAQNEDDDDDDQDNNLFTPPKNPFSSLWGF